MNLRVHPILRELRGLYDVGERHTLDRYRAYTRLMADGPERLPLGDFSPMGRRQPEYLDALLELDAEGLAATYAREIETELDNGQADFRLLLVVVDQPANGWTQRWLTDAAWRFGTEKATGQEPHRRWVSVQLWNHVPPTPGYLNAQLRGAVARATWRLEHGETVTLADMMRQEGAALTFGNHVFAGEPLTTAEDELAYTRQVVAPLRHSEHWPTCFAALYGDEAAREVGFPPLGLSPLAGLALAASENVKTVTQV